MKILLVEDYEEKANDIKSFLFSTFPQIQVDHCTSYNSAQEKIFDATDPYDLILLDMSMTTFDLSSDASGGKPNLLPERIFSKVCICVIFILPSLL